MKIRWAFRCYLTPEQERILARTFGCCRFVYNRFLAAGQPRLRVEGA